MKATLLRQFVRPPRSDHSPTLSAVLEKLDITSFAPESVVQYKENKKAVILDELHRRQGLYEILPALFTAWESQMLNELRAEKGFNNRPGDASVIRFFEDGGVRVAVHLRWEKQPLAEAVGVPDYVKAKAAEIASHLPDATFEVDELHSSEHVYDPFLVVSYGDESYHVEVWTEAEFEREHM
jgi:hypothetical protein